MFARWTVFVDQVKIYVKAGDGGNGCVSFRREKYVPRGGPNGGDGGNGGNVILQTSPHLRTLLDLRYQQHYIGRHAPHGQGKDKHGRNSSDIVIPIPVGTVVYDADTHEPLGDLTRVDQNLLVARGGRGGKGNARFATPVRRAPAFAEPGEKGEERWLLLELKLLADVGLVGLPNAGKSTLISVISAARPKIGPYPFTTLEPHLGVVDAGRHTTFTVADIPGLIEGAHTGRGLGSQFLRHVERCSILAHLVDLSEESDEDPVSQFETVRGELERYGHGLEKKPFLLVGSKLDAGGGGRLDRLRLFARKKKISFFPVSAATGEGIEALVAALARRIRSFLMEEPV